MTLLLEKPAKRGPKPPKRIKRGGPIARKSRPRKERKTPLATLKRQLWEKVKQYVRETHGNTCYTCGAENLAGSNWQTAHYVNAGLSAMTYYDPDNLRPCCYRCNHWLRGNLAFYAEHLRQEIGDTKVQMLLRRSKFIKTWTRPEIADLIAALDRGGADFEMLWAERYGLVNNEGVNA